MRNMKHKRVSDILTSLLPAVYFDPYFTWNVFNCDFLRKRWFDAKIAPIFSWKSFKYPDFHFRLYIRGRSVWLGLLSSAGSVSDLEHFTKAVSPPSILSAWDSCQFLQNISEIKLELSSTKYYWQDMDLKCCFIWMNRCEIIPNRFQYFKTG